MNLRLAPMQSRILAVGLLVLLLLIAVRAVAVPLWRAYFDNRAAIEQYRDDIVRFSRVAARLPSLEKALASLEQRDDTTRYTLGDASETLAAATLQERVKAAVQASGGSLTSTQVLPVEIERDFRRVTVNVRMAVSIEALQKVLYDLESGIPYLVVDNLIVLARQRRRTRRPTGQLLLDVRFNLSGFMAGTTPSG